MVMKRLLSFIGLVIVLPLCSFGQTVVVLDSRTGTPVFNVFVFDKTKTVTAVTNTYGEFEMEPFSGSDTLMFRHSSYKTLEIPRAEIARHGFRVYIDEKLFNLNEVVVSANKWEENMAEIPNEIEVIERKDIIFDNPATTADMLMQSGEVFVQKSQLGGGSPMIRGFAANRILFVVDGVRMNNAIYRSGNLQNVLQTDVNSVESAEVIFGPGTNIYGSDALGGVMDFHIMRPVLNNDKSWRITGDIMMRFASADIEKTGHLKLNIANHKWGFLMLASFSDFNDLRMGAHGDDFYLRNEYVKTIFGKDTIVKNDNPLIQRYSGYSQFNLTQKISYNIDNESELNVNFYMTGVSEVPRYDRLLQESGGTFKYAEWYYKPQQWLMTTVGYNGHKSLKIADNLKAVLAYQNVQEGRNDRKYKKEWLRDRKETVNILSLNIDMTKEFGNRQDLFYGMELVYNNVHSAGVERNIYTNEEQIIPSRYPDGGTNVLNGGVYFTYKKNFERPFTFQAGMRGSYYWLSADFTDTSWYHLPYTNITLNNGAVTGSIGLIYHPEGWKIGMNLSSGFRAPNLDDVAKVFDSEPGNVVVPNENLKPEYLYNADLTIEKAFGEICKVSVTGFYSYLDNAMVRGDYTLNGQDSILYDGEMSKVQAVINTGYAHIYGVNGSLFFRFMPSLAMEMKANYIKGYDDNDEPLRHVSPFFGEASLFYEYKRLQLELNTCFNGEISYENMAPSERDKVYLYAKDVNGNPYSPAWWTLNFHGSYVFNSRFLLTIGLENILDKRYRPYSSGITAPGINFIAGLRISF
jgi:hemoglobin/transferrin/lactoferrin receptor protein